MRQSSTNRRKSKLDRATRAVFKANTGMNPGSRAPLDEWHPVQWMLARSQAKAALRGAGIKS